jgi:hypothetical protein
MTVDLSGQSPANWLIRRIGHHSIHVIMHVCPCWLSDAGSNRIDRWGTVGWLMPERRFSLIFKSKEYVVGPGTDGTLPLSSLLAIHSWTNRWHLEFGVTRRTVASNCANDSHRAIAAVLLGIQRLDSAVGISNISHDRRRWHHRITSYPDRDALSRHGWISCIMYPQTGAEAHITAGPK